jgi:hypothetical protein
VSQQTTNSLPLTVMPGDRIFVNSVHSIGRKALDHRPEVDNDGSISVEEFLHQSGHFESVTLPSSAEFVIGRVMIRRGIEQMGLDLRGAPYSSRQARNLMREADFLLRTKGKWRVRIPFTYQSSLAAYVQGHVDAAAQAHRDQLAIARERRHQVRFTFRVTDRSAQG